MEILITGSLAVKSMAANVLFGLLEMIFTFLHHIVLIVPLHVLVLLGLLLRIDLVVLLLVVTVWLLGRRKVELLMMPRRLIEGRSVISRSIALHHHFLLNWSNYMIRVGIFARSRHHLGRLLLEIMVFSRIQKAQFLLLVLTW